MRIYRISKKHWFSYLFFFFLRKNFYNLDNKNNSNVMQVKDHFLSESNILKLLKPCFWLIFIKFNQKSFKNLGFKMQKINPSEFIWQDTHNTAIPHLEDCTSRQFNCISLTTQEIYIKIWSVSTRLSEHLFAVRHLNKLESVNISIYKQNKSKI